jgi:hypothetical protein
MGYNRRKRSEAAEMFIGRDREQAELREKLSNDRFEAILLYGRRRIGKTELVKKVAESFDGKVIYYECKRSLLGDNIEGFNQVLQQTFQAGFSFRTVKEAFRYVFEYSKQNRVLLIIDELPFLLNESPILVSDIRDLIDEYKSNTAMKLILLGSYVDTMKSLNDGNSETYGRFTGIIELKAFDYYDSAQFYPRYNDEDKFLMYSVFGGVAFFNSLIDDRLSAVENIKRLLIAKNSILQLEIEHTVSAETSKVPLVNSVIELIGRGVKKYSDISRLISEKKDANVNPDYLIKKLVDLELIEKVVPINDKGNKKKIAYVFHDNLLEFYYRYIYRNKNMNAVLSTDDFYSEIIEEDLYRQYLPEKFEQVSREFLIRVSQRHRLQPVIYEIGTYSFDDAKKKVNRQFDVVTRDKNGYIAYECKYTKEKLGMAVINEEEFQIRDSGLEVYKLGFISKNGFSEGIDGKKYNLFELKDFYVIG